MKKTVVYVLAIMILDGILSMPVNAGVYISPSIGIFDPQGEPEAGVFAGISFEGKVDRNVMVGGEIDVYHKSYIEEQRVADYIDEFGNLVTSVVRTIDTTSTLLPIMGSIRVNLTNNNSWNPYVGGGIGYQFLFNHFDNYVEGVSRNSTFGGIAYRLGFGIDHALSRKTTMFFEGFYQMSTVSRETGRFYIGLPVRDQIDFDGLGFRVGLRFGEEKGPHESGKYRRPPRRRW